MNSRETAQVIMYLKGVYPRYYSAMNNEQMELQIKVWTDLFSEYSVEAVMSGVRTFATTDASGFPPVPGQIIENMYRVAHLTDDSAIKAWNLVRRAINMPRDQYGLAYDALPEDVRETLGTKENAIATLTSWGMVPTEQFETVVQSNFLRSYEAVKRGRTKEKYMPKKVLAGRGNVYKELSQKTTPNVEIGTIEINTGTEELVKKLADRKPEKHHHSKPATETEKYSSLSDENRAKMDKLFARLNGTTE